MGFQDLFCFKGIAVFWKKQVSFLMPQPFKITSSIMKTLNWKIGNKCMSVLNIDAHLLRKKILYSCSKSSFTLNQMG